MDFIHTYLALRIYSSSNGAHLGQAITAGQTRDREAVLGSLKDLPEGRERTASSESVSQGGLRDRSMTRSGERKYRARPNGPTGWAHLDRCPWAATGSHQDRRVSSLASTKSESALLTLLELASRAPRTAHRSSKKRCRGDSVMLRCCLHTASDTYNFFADNATSSVGCVDSTIIVRETIARAKERHAMRHRAHVLCVAYRADVHVGGKAETARSVHSHGARRCCEMKAGPT